MMTWLVLGCALGYALLRYLVLGPVPASQIPAFLVNKAASMAGVLLVALAMMRKLQGGDAETPLKGGIWLILLHLCLTLPLFGAGTYPSLFQGGSLGAWGQGVLLSGALGTLLLLKRVQTSQAHAGLLLLAAAHVALLGWRGWMNPTSWHGGLPPITLLVFVPSAAMGAWGLLGSRRKAPKACPESELAGALN